MSITIIKLQSVRDVSQLRLAHGARILLQLLKALILTSRTVLNKMIAEYVQLGAVNLVQSDLGRILATFLFPG